MLETSAFGAPCSRPASSHIVKSGEGPGVEVVSPTFEKANQNFW